MNPEENIEKPVESLPKKPEVDKKPIRSLRTYQGDVEEALSKHNTSAASILVAEQNRRLEETGDTEPRRDSGAKNKFFLLLGGLLIVLGIFTVVAVYYIRSNAEVQVDRREKTLTVFSEEKILAIASSTREQLVNTIVSERQNFGLPVNSILYINTVDTSGQPADIETVFSLLAPKMPGALARSFSDEYMIGVYSFDRNDLFMILKTDEYSQSFSGMLQWEKDIPSDIGKLFSIPQNASTTLAFTDVELRNRDLRVLKDTEGRTYLLYSFIDKGTVLITTNENIFAAVLAKYTVSTQTQ